MKRHRFINPEDLPQGSILYLYGAGGFGARAKRYIEIVRPDVTIRGFLDTHRGGHEHGLPVWEIGDTLPNDLTESLILITCSHWQDVVVSLELAGLSNYKLLSNMELVFSFDFLQKQQSLTRQAEAVGALFDNPRDRRFWDHIVATMGHDAEWVANRREHYLDHIQLRPGDVVIDAGVLDGITSIQFSDAVGPTGRVYGFDPFGDPFKAPFRETALWLDNIRILPYALWSSAANLYFCEDAILSDHFKTYVAPAVSEAYVPDATVVKAQSIDGFAEEIGLDRLDYLKMDIEGAEKEALRGAERTLARLRPQLAISLYHRLEDYFEIPLYLSKLLPNYRYHIEKYSCWGWYEVVLYGLPEERIT